MMVYFTFLAKHKVRKPSMAYMSRSFWVLCAIFLLWAFRCGLPSGIKARKTCVVLVSLCTTYWLKMAGRTCLWILPLKEFCSRSMMPESAPFVYITISFVWGWRTIMDILLRTESKDKISSTSNFSSVPWGSWTVTWWGVRSFKVKP